MIPDCTEETQAARSSAVVVGMSPRSVCVCVCVCEYMYFGAESYLLQIYGCVSLNGGRHI